MSTRQHEPSYPAPLRGDSELDTGPPAYFTKAEKMSAAEQDSYAQIAVKGLARSRRALAGPGEVFDPSESEANEDGLASDETDMAPDRLTIQDKLEALLGDERAGFLPATRPELSRAVEFLDYLTPSPEHRHGVLDRWQEILFHQKRGYFNRLKLAQDAAETEKAHAEYIPSEADKRAANNEGIKTLVILGRKYVGYYRDARAQLANLEQLRKAIQDRDNPNTPLTEIAKDLPAGVNALFRFMDINRVRNGKETDELFNPLQAIHNQKGPRRHEDRDIYTSGNAGEYIQERAQSTKVGAVRKIVDQAVENERHRLSFWEKILIESEKHGAVRIATSPTVKKIKATKVTPKAS